MVNQSENANTNSSSGPTDQDSNSNSESCPSLTAIPTPIPDSKPCSDVRNMIQIFTKLKANGSSILSSVKNFDLLINSLLELDSLVEMKVLKLSVLSQLKFLIVKKLHDAKNGVKTNSVFEGHMLHSVIYGPPGVGKTKVGCILANIWLSLALVSVAMPTSTPTSTSTSTQTTLAPPSQDPTDNLVSKLESRQRTWLEKLEILHQQMMAQKDCFNVIQDEIEKLSDKNKLTTSEQNKLYTTIDDGSKYVDMCIGVITEEFYREKPQLSDKSNHQSPVANGVNTDTLISLVKKMKPVSSLDSSLVKIVSRPDFVAEYLGQTAIKTLELLKSNLGKVLFIDEAYSLVNSDRDSYGMEALTVINQFMTEHPHDIIIILAGYKDMIEKNIFETQPGLKRRFTWIFEVNGYTPSGLADIFRTQITDSGWQISDSVDLNEFFGCSKDSFPSFGGDTVKLAFYCKLAFANSSFTSFVRQEFEMLSCVATGATGATEATEATEAQTSIVDIQSKTIDSDILREGFKLYKENQVNDNSSLTCFMYV